MTPLMLLVVLVAATLVTVAVDRGRRRSAGRAYRRLAVAHGMHYARGDPLRVTPRVAAALPVPGAGGVRVIDLLYRTDGAGHHYVFTAEYTVGVVAGKRRVRRAGAFHEPKRSVLTPGAVTLAIDNVPLLDQYRMLLGEGSDPAAGGQRDGGAA